MPAFLVYTYKDDTVAARILSRARRTANDPAERTTIRDGRETVVIADSGAEAEVLVFPSGQVIGEGFEFRHRGTTWVITGRRRDSGLLVAEPSAH